MAGEVERWVTGVRPKPGTDDGDVLEGDPLRVEDRKLNVIVGLWLGPLGGWYVPFTTSLSGHTQCPPLVGPSPGWLRAPWHPRVCTAKTTPVRRTSMQPSDKGGQRAPGRRRHLMFWFFSRLWTQERVVGGCRDMSVQGLP